MINTAKLTYLTWVIGIFWQLESFHKVVFFVIASILKSQNMEIETLSTLGSQRNDYLMLFGAATRFQEKYYVDPLFD